MTESELYSDRYPQLVGSDKRTGSDSYGRQSSLRRAGNSFGIGDEEHLHDFYFHPGVCRWRFFCIEICNFWQGGAASGRAQKKST